jgi:hypothetical protein
LIQRCEAGESVNLSDINDFPFLSTTVLTKISKGEEIILESWRRNESNHATCSIMDGSRNILLGLFPHFFGISGSFLRISLLLQLSGFVMSTTDGTSQYTLAKIHHTPACLIRLHY